jgi:hypothetical protein
VLAVQDFFTNPTVLDGPDSNASATLTQTISARTNATFFNIFFPPYKDSIPSVNLISNNSVWRLKSENSPKFSMFHLRLSTFTILEREVQEFIMTTSYLPLTCPRTLLYASPETAFGLPQSGQFAAA